MIAAVYTRVSTTSQEQDGNSLEGQRVECVKLAEELGYEVVNVFSDTHTGSQFEERQGLQSLLASMRNNDFDVVIAWSQDRISRVGYHTSMIAYALQQSNTELKLVNGTFDTTAEGQLMQSVQAFVAQTERIKITERTMMGKERRVAEGRPLAGFAPPFGYQWEHDAKGEKTKLVINEEQAKVVRWIINQVIVEGRSLTKVAKELNDKGVRSSQGGEWTSSNISKFLRTGVYVGKYEAFNHSKSIASVIIETPAIITEEQQQAFIVALSRNQQFSKRRLADDTLLRGYAFCYCGARLNPTTSKRTTKGVEKSWLIYQCNNSDRHYNSGKWRGRIAAQKLDNAVWQTIAQALTNREHLEKARERGASEDPTMFDRGVVEGVMKDKQRRLNNLTKAISQTDDDDTRALILLQYKEVRNDLFKLGEELQALQLRYESWKTQEHNLLALDEFVEKAAQVLATELSIEKKRVLMEALQVKVVVRPRLSETDNAPNVELSWIAQPNPMPLRMAYHTQPVVIDFTNTTCSGDSRR